MNRRRIAFFGDDFARKGKGTALVIQKLVEELVLRHGSEVEIVLLRPAGECQSPVCDKVENVIIPRRFSTLLSYYWFFVTHSGTYDVVVFNRVVYPGFWFLRAKKFIVFLYDASRSEVYVTPRGSVNLAFEYFIRFVGKYFFDVAVAVSDDGKKWLARYYALSPRKISTIYGAASDEYAPIPSEKKQEAMQQLEKKYGIRSPYILSVARFDPHKNIQGVIASFNRVKKEGSSRTLVMVGGRHLPEYSDRIERMIRESPYTSDIIVLDYVEPDDMPALYGCADVLVFPSLVEGFGMPIIEAMQCGTPVVTSNISCLPEIAGGAAELVDPKNADAVAEAVKRVLSEGRLRNDLIAKGLERARDFSWQKSVEAFLKLV